MVNIVNVDTNFDLGDASQPIKNNSYFGKIIELRSKKRVQ